MIRRTLACLATIHPARQLPKLNVTSSNLVTRSWGCNPQEPTCGFSTVKVLTPTHTKGGQTPAPRASGAGIFLAKGFVVSPLEEFIHRVPEDTERGIASMRIELEPLKLLCPHHPGDGGSTYTQQLPRLFCRQCLSFCHRTPLHRVMQVYHITNRLSTRTCVLIPPWTQKRRSQGGVSCGA